MVRIDSSRLNKEELGRFCICLWKVWAMRNVAVHDLSSIQEVNIVEWARRFVTDRSVANFIINRAAGSLSIRNPLWIPPVNGVYKINSDAALDVVGMSVGVVIIIRNSKVIVMASSS